MLVQSLVSSQPVLLQSFLSPQLVPSDNKLAHHLLMLDVGLASVVVFFSHSSE